MHNETIDYVRAVIPMLICRDGAAEIEFCKAAFRAVERSRRLSDNGAVLHSTLSIGEALIMVHGEATHLASRPPELDGSSSVVIYIYLEDVDDAMARAVAAGAKVLLPAADQFWGDRLGRILDPAGHVWNVASRPKAPLSAK
jgi:PhnB protein